MTLSSGDIAAFVVEATGESSLEVRLVCVLSPLGGKCCAPEVCLVEDDCPPQPARRMTTETAITAKHFISAIGLAWNAPKKAEGRRRLMMQCALAGRYVLSPSDWQGGSAPPFSNHQVRSNPHTKRPRAS